MSDITDKPRQITQITQLMPDLSRAADKYGTPVYVIDMASVDAAARQIEAAFGGSWLLHYSLKANDLPAIAGYLARRGWGGSVVSTGEWQYAAHAGLANDAIAFEGIGKTDAQLEHAVAEAAAGRPVRWLVLESAEETERLSQLAFSYRLGHGGRPPPGHHHARHAPRRTPPLRFGARADRVTGAVLRQPTTRSTPALRLKRSNPCVSPACSPVRSATLCRPRACSSPPPWG